MKKRRDEEQREVRKVRHERETEFERETYIRRYCVPCGGGYRIIRKRLGGAA